MEKRKRIMGGPATRDERTGHVIESASMRHKLLRGESPFRRPRAPVRRFFIFDFDGLAPD